MSREVHVRICERVGVRFPGATQRLLGFAGPKHEAKEIKSRIRAVLRAELTLELSESKTLITHAASQAARFLSMRSEPSTLTTSSTDGVSVPSMPRSDCSCPSR